MFTRAIGAVAFAATAFLTVSPAAAISMDAAYATPKYTCGATGVSTGTGPFIAASDCAGNFTVASVASGNADIVSIADAINADGGFAGYETWTAAATLTLATGTKPTATVDGTAFTVTSTSNGNLTNRDVGLWSISGLSAAVDAVAILLVTDTGRWAVYMVDLATAGRFSSLGANFGGGAKPPLTSITFLTATADVPLPAAAPLLLTGLLGLGALRRRRAAALG